MTRAIVCLVAALATTPSALLAQAGGGRAGGSPQPPATPRAAGPGRSHRLLGVGRHRGLAVSNGDASEGRLSRRADDAGRAQDADSWDPAKEEASGEVCKAYGAPALLRVPGRLHITWQDDQTLKLETDAGQQTRLFHFERLEIARRSAHSPGRVGGGMGGRRPRRDRRLARRSPPRTSKPASCGRTACRTARTSACRSTTR